MINRIKGKKNGFGREVNNENEYEGFWIDNQKSGKGKLIFLDQSVYEGN